LDTRKRVLIRLAQPDIRSSDIKAVAEVLRSGDLVQGKWVARFEEALARFTGLPHCAVVSSCTAALHLALLALGIRRGDAVLVPAFTFPATANVVENLGARTVLCDVDSHSYVMTPQAAERALRADSAIRAIILVHEFGYPAAIADMAAMARQRGVRVIEDAACALGTKVDGLAPGHLSDVACYSFHPRKAVTTGEGGALVSRDRDLVERAKRLRNHGMTRTHEAAAWDFVDAGLNYRMTDFQAVLGACQLERFADELASRHAQASSYLTELAGLPAVSLPAAPNGHSWQSFMVVLDATHEREKVRTALHAEGVETTIGAQALNCLSYFRRQYNLSQESFPHATRLFRHGLVLPLHGRLSTAESVTISAALRRILGGG
jgi:dTDP-4-amino-4,6-dideoxygalactose transaminase